MQKQQRFEAVQKATVIGFTANVVIAVFKIVAAIIGRSEAVLADAIESLTDAVSSTIVWVSLRVGNKPSDEEHPYGHQRIETASGLIVAMIIIVVGLLIIGRSAQSIISKEIEIPSNFALMAAIISSFWNEGFHQYTIRVSRKLNSAGLRAIAWDFRKDALTGFVALAGVVGAKLGIRILDPIAAAAIAFIIIKIGYDVGRHALNELIDIAPDAEVMEKIKKITESVPGVEHLRRYRARKSGHYIFVDVEIEIDEKMSIAQGHEKSSSI